MIKESIKVVSILGANGTMGRNIAAIFASFGNAQVYLISRLIQAADLLDAVIRWGCLE